MKKCINLMLELSPIMYYNIFYYLKNFSALKEVLILKGINTIKSHWNSIPDTEGKISEVLRSFSLL